MRDMRVDRVSAGRARGDVGPIMGRVVVVAIAAVVLAATVSEASVALGLVGIGRSQAGASARDVLVVTGVFSLLGGGAIFTTLSLTRFLGVFHTRLMLLVAPAAAALMVARFYSYDPYYAPHLRRMSDGGILSGRWIILISALALAAAAVTRRRPRVGLIATSAAMWLCALTTVVAGLGH